jgi:hypothetical protein
MPAGDAPPDRRRLQSARPLSHGVVLGSAAGDTFAEREEAVHFLPATLAVAARDRIEDTVVDARLVELRAAVGGDELAHAQWAC